MFCGECGEGHLGVLELIYELRLIWNDLYDTFEAHLWIFIPEQVREFAQTQVETVAEPFGLPLQ